MPPFHLATTFLGQPCGSGWTHGVNPEMHERLRAADEKLRAIYDALSPERRIDALTGLPHASFSQWGGVSAPHVCWRAHAAQHSAGAAIDLNPAANPYIVTRTGGVFGGERGGELLVGMRSRAFGAYDRAMAFTGGAADLSARRDGETTEAVWARFKAVSEALVAYLGLVVDPAPPAILRPALENADEVPDDVLLSTIGEDERIPEDAALPALERFTVSPRELYLRILRDYEHARIPMTLDEPSATPARTRNPARGFLSLPCEVPSALCEQGLRWGACDFPLAPDGSSQNGAMMHFDLADSGGYPEIDSLLRFG